MLFLSQNVHFRGRLIYSHLNCDCTRAVSDPRQFYLFNYQGRGEAEAWSIRNQPRCLKIAHGLALCIFNAVSLLVSVVAMGVRHCGKSLITRGPTLDDYLINLLFTTPPAPRRALSLFVVSAAGAFPPMHFLYC